MKHAQLIVTTLVSWMHAILYPIGEVWMVKCNTVRVGSRSSPRIDASAKLHADFSTYTPKLCTYVLWNITKVLRYNVFRFLFFRQLSANPVLSGTWGLTCPCGPPITSEKTSNREPPFKFRNVPQCMCAKFQILTPRMRVKVCAVVE